MKKFKQVLLSSLLVLGFGVLVLSPSVGAVNAFPVCDKNSTNADNVICQASGNDDIKTVIRNVINILLFVLGAVAVVVIIFGGIFYTTSMGDAALIKKAKETIMYAVIGLVVAMSAYAIVNFVVNWGK